jgi:4-alpha-glucanotransferase
MTGVPQLSHRTSGILLHLTSLPGAHGNGDLGADARAFADYLARAKQSFWQMLPVGPCGYGNSPYSAQSAFAGNPLLIALEPLCEAGYLGRAELDRAPAFAAERVDFEQAERFRTRCLRSAFEAARLVPAFLRYCEDNSSWLTDYALFRALKTRFGEVEWTRWPAEYRDREPAALERARLELAADIGFRSFEQWQFSEQWRALRAYCHERAIGLIGDLPIFLAHDSADVWQHRELFRLDAAGMPTVVAGVPPDYFSATGQRWGNPLYDWERLRQTGYGFWVDRMRMMLERFDVVRLDHFIGFVRNWEIPASEPTAVHGRWIKGPGAALFDTLLSEFGRLPLIAEDLGEVNEEVKHLRDQFELPGIKILQFAFGTDASAPDFMPHNYPPRAVVYTGTHDNDTTAGWFWAQDETTSNRSSEQAERERSAALTYLAACDASEIHWDMIRMCMLSVANTAIFPLQDVLGLGSEARMNRPGRAVANWEWRCTREHFRDATAERLASLVQSYDRRRLSVVAGGRP